MCYLGLSYLPDVGYHNAEFSTPVIDAMAAAGVKLDQYYVQPSCTPSRVAFLSARFPYNVNMAHKALNMGLPV